MALCHRGAVVLLMAHALAWLLLPESNVPVWFHRPRFAESCTCPLTGSETSKQTHRYISMFTYT